MRSSLATQFQASDDRLLASCPTLSFRILLTFRAPGDMRLRRGKAAYPKRICSMQQGDFTAGWL